MTPLFGNAKGRTSFKLKEVHGLYINYLNGMMFRLQEQFQLDPNENIIIEGTPNCKYTLFMFSKSIELLHISLITLFLVGLLN